MSTVTQKGAAVRGRSLLSERPDLAEQWAAENPLPPSAVAPRSNKSFLWRCALGHTWTASPANRARVEHSACRECGKSTDPVAVKSYLKLRYGIDRSWLSQHYVESEASLDDLWAEFGVGHRVIRRALAVYNLEKSSETIQLHRTSKREATNLRLYGHPQPNSFAFSVQKSQPEREIAGLLQEWGVGFNWGDTQLIAPKELDFYLPDHSIAIEYNGEHWHQKELWLEDLRNGTSLSREAVKEKLCAEQGVRLVHLWETEWLATHDRAGYLLSRLSLAGLELV